MKPRRRGRGCLLALLLLAAAAGLVAVGMYPFLARHAPVASEVLVIEGWLGDVPLARAVGWAESNGVRRIYTTGGPIETGSWLAPWGTYAEMTQARLEAMGAAGRFEVIAAPAGPVRRGRTRESARGVQAAWPLKRGAFNLASAGPHMRRSWRVFRRVFGDGVEVGCVAVEPAEFGGGDWWRCSEGVRTVVGEAIAYGYDVVTGGGGE